MSRHLSVGTAIEKSRIASENAFIILIRTDVKDSGGNIVDTVRFCKNSENIIYQGDIYYAANFKMTVSADTGEEPSISLVAQDQKEVLIPKIELYDGMVNSEIEMTVINAGALTTPPEMRETFKILSTSVKNFIVSIKLGSENPLQYRFPVRNQHRDRCGWVFKGPRCKYAGAVTSCDYTIDGVNGCAGKSNTINFGGYPGLRTLFGV